MNWPAWWLVTLTAMRPEAGWANECEVLLCNVSHAWALILALSKGFEAKDLFRFRTVHRVPEIPVLL